MERITISQLYAEPAAYADKIVTVAGWARSIRDMKNLGFLSLNDGSCFKNLQVILDKALPNYAELAGQNVGAAFIVTGKLVLTPDAKQPFELQTAEAAVEGVSAPD
jgi:asparaginyl-tRNA synthetase